MSATVVPFPLTRRRDMIHRQAEYALCLKPEKAEQHIQRQLQTQAAAMHRRGIAEDLINRELASMEAAIRADMWHLSIDAPSEA
jgi:hypothetical protein